MQVFINILIAALVLGSIGAALGAGVARLSSKASDAEEKTYNKKEPLREEKNKNLRAFVKCNGVECEKKYTYAGAKDCLAASLLAGGPNSCEYSCLGLGSCVEACAYGAISVETGVAVVDEEKCTGCGACENLCPRGIIVLLPSAAEQKVQCANKNQGSKTRKICEDGCIGCFACVNTCKHDAISIEDNLAVIDYDKCTSCGECAPACPRKTIISKNEETVARPFDELEYFNIKLPQEMEKVQEDN